MAWSMDGPLRLIRDGKVYKPFVPATEWWCDPCALPGRRYRIGDREYAWWEVIDPSDDARTRYCKWHTNKAIAEIGRVERHYAWMRRTAEIYGLGGLNSLQREGMK